MPDPQTLFRQTLVRLHRSPDDLLVFLKFSARLYRHSPVNQIMIYAQNPECSFAAEELVWQSLGRSVYPDKAIHSFKMNGGRMIPTALFDAADTTGPEDAFRKAVWVPTEKELIEFIAAGQELSLFPPSPERWLLEQIKKDKPNRLEGTLLAVILFERFQLSYPRTEILKYIPQLSQQEFNDLLIRISQRSRTTLDHIRSEMAAQKEEQQHEGKAKPEQSDDGQIHLSSLPVSSGLERGTDPELGAGRKAGSHVKPAGKSGKSLDAAPSSQTDGESAQIRLGGFGGENPVADRDSDAGRRNGHGGPDAEASAALPSRERDSGTRGNDALLASSENGEAVPAYDPLSPAYQTGDTVYLDDTAFIIENIDPFHVELRDPTLAYPIFRTENKERFEQLLHLDSRNSRIFEYLPTNLKHLNEDIREILTVHLLTAQDKDAISSWLQSGETNTRIAQRLSEIFAGRAETAVLETGDTADFFVSAVSIDAELHDKFGTKQYLSWMDAAPILRAMYQQGSDGFAHKSKQQIAPTIREIYKKYKPILQEKVLADTAYQNACRNSDKETALLEGDAAVKRAALIITDTAFMKLYYDMGDFHHRLHREIVAETYPMLSQPDKLPLAPQHTNSEADPKTKFQANVTAIQLLKQLDVERRSAAPEERQVLAAYSGWGGIPKAFDAQAEDWQEEYRQLSELLTEEEYTLARSSTLTAFYTKPEIAAAIWQKLSDMGFQSGRVLEPSMGTGCFFSTVPERINPQLTGIELDTISGNIARQLYPGADIRIQGFEDFDPSIPFDAVIGNIPFGNFSVYDPKYNPQNFLIHDYFFAKALALTRPGGIVAFITSMGTLDKKDSAVRKALAREAELLGAVRLPRNAFGGTEVTADILFLQKRPQSLDIEPEWVSLGLNAENIPMNQYFIDHPEMILGKMGRRSGLFGEEYVCFPEKGHDLIPDLRKALSVIDGHFQLEQEETPKEIAPTLPPPADCKRFGFAVVDGALYYRESGDLVLQQLPEAKENRIKAIVSLRDGMREIIRLQLEEGYSEALLKEKQQALEQQYDRFVKTYGVLSSQTNQQAFAEDTDAPLVLALEDTSSDGTVTKGDFFFKATIRPQQAFQIHSAEDALTVCLNTENRLDEERIRQLCRHLPIDPIADLSDKDLIFENPATGLWETAAEYLSGAVRDKLEFARVKAEEDDRFAKNVSALEKVQPRPLDFSEIQLQLGSSWIPREFYKAFLYEYLGTPFYCQGDGSRDIALIYDDATSRWTIYNKGNDNSPKVTLIHGTNRANGYRIMEDCLNLTATTVTDEVEGPDGKKRRAVNTKETAEARVKQEQMKQHFVEWIGADVQRMEQLAALYNEKFNRYRPRTYDGSCLSFPGMTPEIELLPHQKDAVARILQGGNTLLAHVVGAGKTFEMIAAGMKLRQTGTARKILYVVPNHLVLQWGADFLKLYPAANILVASKKDFETANRRKFLGKIAAGEYDAIIIAQSQFEKIPMSEDFLREKIEREIDALKEALFSLPESRNRDNYFTIKNLERQKKRLEAQLKAMADTSKKDQVITFEETGIDQIFIDEAHYYKNCYVMTKIQNVAGITVAPAAKSFDLLVKTEYLSQLRGGKGVVFATGTPITNSISEMYIFQRYLQQEMLMRSGLRHFDDWASTFGIITTNYELKPEGNGFQQKSRFAKFGNLPELMGMFQLTADIKTQEDLHLPRAEMEGGKRQVVKTAPSKFTRDYIAMLGEQADRIRAGGVDPSEWNFLKIATLGKKAALSPLLVGGEDPFKESKIYTCCEKVMEYYRKTESEKGLQLIFLDFGLELYEVIKEELIEKGMKEKEIAFISDARNDKQKAALFARCRSGEVRLLIGSTQKMGAGTNIQDRLCAIHHLDAPWRPADLEQRDGRGLRRGNRFSEVGVLVYVTDATFDSYLYQVLENKQRFIGQVMTGKSAARNCDDIDDTALEYGEIKMLTCGDPRIKEKFEVDNLVQQLKMEQSAWQQEQLQIGRLIERLPGEAEDFRRALERVQADLKQEAACTGTAFAITVNGKLYDDRTKAGEAFRQYALQVPVGKTEKIAEFHGFAVSAYRADLSEDIAVIAAGQHQVRFPLSESGIGSIMRLENLAARFGEEEKRLHMKIAETQKALADAEGQLGRPFPRAALLEQTIERQTRLVLELSDKPQPMEPPEVGICQADSISLVPVRQR